MNKLQEKPTQAEQVDQADMFASTIPSACWNYGGRDDTPWTGVSSFPYAPPSGRGRKGPGNTMLISSSRAAGRGNTKINKSQKSY